MAVQAAPAHDPFGLIEKVVRSVTSPSELPLASKASAVKLLESPAVIVAVDGATTMWSTAAVVTCSAAFALFPEFVPVTVWAPTVEAVQVAPVHEPSGAIENVVEPVTSPSEFPAASKPVAVYACELPAPIVALAGLIVMWSRLPALTFSEAVPVLPAAVPVTVCAPAVEAVQLAPRQDPSGPIVKPEERRTTWVERAL